MKQAMPFQDKSGQCETYAMRQIRSCDAGEHAQGPQGWNLKIDQLSPGQFTGIFSEIVLENIQILREQTNQVLIKSGQARPGTVVFTLPLAALGDGSCCGQPIYYPYALLVEGGELPPLRTPAMLDLACFVLDHGWLVEMANTVEHVDLENTLGRLRCIQLTEATHARLQMQFHSLFQSLPLSPCAPQALHHIEQTLALGILDALAISPIDEIVSSSVRKRIIDKAKHFALHAPDEPPTIYDLCKEIGVSRRKLQNCFLEEFGVSPAHYLRTIRLNAVRRDLRQGSTADTRIGEVAAKWGFWHLGRFSADYKAMFGELPSNTVRAS